MIQGWHDIAALVAAVFGIIGAILFAQWLYYWPKVQSVVKAAVVDAMTQEHAYVLREIERVDRRHDIAILAITTKIAAVESGISSDLAYIRSRVDRIVDRLYEESKK